MKKTITYEIDDKVYEALGYLAKAEGRPVDVLVIEWLAEQEAKHVQTKEKRKTADDPLLKYAGIENSGNPTGADNESIDADLAREYGSSHEDEV